MHGARVRVRAGSRLHAGFYAIVPGARAPWRGAGFYVDEPAFEAVVEEDPGGPRVEGARETLAAVEAALRALGGPPVRVRVDREPPAHSGFGSTTQASLSVYCAVKALRGEDCDPAGAAVALGRGRFSWVGTLAFTHGGFVADAGAPDPGGPRLLLRHPVPDGWAFVVAVPEVGRGPGEDVEEGLMSRPQPPPPAAERMMALGFLRLARGVAAGDLLEALEGLRLMQTGTGLYFRSAGLQDGVYRGALSEVVAEASRDGMVLAQSSWGPALYTITTAEDARGDAGVLAKILRDLGLRGRVFVARPRNVGASFEALRGGGG